MRIGGSAVFSVRGVSRWLAAIMAALVVLAVTVPGAWAADDKPSVDLKENQKTSVSVGSATVNATYQLGNATVTGASSYITVQVDSGSFTPNADAPAGAEAADALNASGVYVDGGAKKDGSYTYASFKSSDNNASVTATAVQDYLRGLTFTLSGDAKQTVTVSVVAQPLKASYNGQQYDATLFNGNAYTFIENKSIAWDKAYEAAKQTTFVGTKGHLLTIESSSEHSLIFKSFKNKTGFMGATRYTTAEQAKQNADTFTPASGGDAWYWVTGPSAGTMILTKGTRQDGGASPTGVYTNWSDGEPNASGRDKEGYGQYGHGDAGQWNDVANDGTYGDGGTRHIDGFYVEFEDVNLDEAGTTVSATTRRVDVTYDLDDGKVSSVSSVSKMLTNNGDYETTLSVAEAVAGRSRAVSSRQVRAAVARELDAASVKVTVDGEALSRGDDGYSFEESSGRLTIPAAKVTGAVQISAKVKRLVTITDDKDAELGVKSLAYGAQLTQDEADKLAKKSGYTISGYKNEADSSDYTFPQAVTEDVTLVASYTLDAPQVTVTQDKAQLETRADKASVSVDVKKPVADAVQTVTWSKGGKELPECKDKTMCEITEAGTYTVTVTEKDADGKTSTVTKEVTIAAPTEHTVTVKDGDTTKTFQVTNGDPLGADNVAGTTKQGYTLTGWRTGDGASFDPAATPVTGPLTVSPVWVLDAPGVTVAASPSKIESVGDRARIEATVTPPAVAGGQVATEYKWFRDGELIDGATGSSYETAEPGTYRVEVAVADPATGETSTAGREVTVAAPDTRTVTVVERDGSRTYVTVEVPNGGTVDVSDLSQVGKDGYELSGWVTTDGKPFDPAKDKLTADMTISPVWKLVEPTVSITDDRGTLRVEVDNPAGAKVEYQWFKDGRLLSGQAGATLEGAGPGAYTVRVTLTDAEGNTVTVERQVTVDASSSRDTLASTGASPVPALFALAFLLAAAAGLALSRRLS